MIIQSAPEGTAGARFVIKLDEHEELAWQFAEAFGNRDFEAPVPREEIVYIARWHDNGWLVVDDAPPIDPATRLPYNLVETPVELLCQIGPRSAAHNEAHHPYCGLLVSMHIWGLYNGRYGLSDKIVIDDVPADERPAVEAMLEGELARQQRLREALSAEPATRLWVDDERLFTNYKLLQFFDTLALYFNLTHEDARPETRFFNVPAAPGRDMTLTLRPRAPGVYALSPFPFREDTLDVFFTGRYLEPVEGEADTALLMRTTPRVRQPVRLVAA